MPHSLGYIVYTLNDIQTPSSYALKIMNIISCIDNTPLSVVCSNMLYNSIGYIFQ